MYLPERGPWFFVTRQKGANTDYRIKFKLYGKGLTPVKTAKYLGQTISSCSSKTKLWDSDFKQIKT